MNRTFLNVMTTIASSVAAAALIGLYVTLTSLKTDVAVTKALAEEHKVSHMRHDELLYSIPPQVSSLRSDVDTLKAQIKFNNGDIVADGN